MGLSISGGVRDTLQQAWPRAMQRALAALLPQDCVLCGAFAGAPLLCPECAESLPRLPAATCPVCAAPVPGNVGATICGACLKAPPHFDATAAVFIYAFPLDKLVQQLKFAHRLAIADFFGHALLDSGLPVADLIIPVPLSAGRLRERGFNQSLEIAKVLGRASGIALEPGCCHRLIETAPQSSLPWKARQRNVRGAFGCTIDLAGKSIMVIDDVMTTGATLDELARTLKNHGAARVVNCVVARAVKGEK